MSYKLPAQASAEGIIRVADGAFIPNNLENYDWRAYQAWVAAGNTALPADPLPGSDLQSQVVEMVQRRLDNFAHTRAYDGILSACTYCTSQVPKFQVEGQYCVDARDAHWAQCYAILEEVLTGTRPMPTLEEVEAELPLLAWPN